MEKKNQSRMAGVGDRVTSTISVTLVLFILGLVATINITFNTLDRELKEKMGFAVVLCDSVSTEAVDKLQQLCQTSSYISDYQYLSSEDVLLEEAGADGPALVEMLGVNPYSPMFDIKVKRDWANVDSISVLIDQWRRYEGVGDVSVNTDMVRNLTRNARLFNTVMLVIAAALLMISFVLINNTVRLTVYSRRFIIHTMKLVGATPGFIRRPFITSNLFQGLIAGVLASGLLAALIGWGKNWDEALEPLLSWGKAGMIFGLILLLGMAICSLAALLATNRYLRADYDEMFD